MKLINESTLLIKKSKFVAYYYKLDSIDEIKDILKSLKEENKKANHFVYAYKFNNTAGKSDDKEPTGSAGLQIYNLINMNELNNVLIVVVRYFGGTKLGIGPLTRSYKNVTSMVIKNI
ncbi:MAG: YigZ family protein [Bacilli bacterium]